MCQIFWHMGTGQRAVPLEPAPWHPLFFLIFSLSAKCVRHFAPISSNLGSGPTKLTLVIFWNFFYKKKKFSLSLKWEIKISSKTLFINKTSSFLVPGWIFKQRKLFFFCCFLMIFSCTHVSDFLAYGYRSEGCASWASTLTPFIFFIFSLSAQCVRLFAPISSNLGFGPTKWTLVIFWNFFSKKKKFSLSLKW